MRPEFDHTLPLIDGGQNRESNLQPLCPPCHKVKTKGEASSRAKERRVRKKHLGIAQRKRKIPGRRFDGTPIWGDRP
jgi:5-methylcytosine-specific restriction endonuclease McrA